MHFAIDKNMQIEQSFAEWGDIGRRCLNLDACPNAVDPESTNLFVCSAGLLEWKLEFRSDLATPDKASAETASTAAMTPTIGAESCGTQIRIQRFDR